MNHRDRLISRARLATAGLVVGAAASTGLLTVAAAQATYSAQGTQPGSTVNGVNTNRRSGDGQGGVLGWGSGASGTTQPPSGPVAGSHSS